MLVMIIHKSERITIVFLKKLTLNKIHIFLYHIYRLTKFYGSKLVEFSDILFEESKIALPFESSSSTVEMEGEEECLVLHPLAIDRSKLKEIVVAGNIISPLRVLVSLLNEDNCNLYCFF